MRKIKDIEGDKRRKEITDRLLLANARDVIANGEKRSAGSIKCITMPELSLKEALKIVKEIKI